LGKGVTTARSHVESECAISTANCRNKNERLDVSESVALRLVVLRNDLPDGIFDEFAAVS
jgi:hypothetical protein